MRRAAMLRTIARAPAVALAVATLAVSFSAVFIRLSDTDPFTLVWLRLGMAAVLLLPWAGGQLPHAPASRVRRDVAGAGSAPLPAPAARQPAAATVLSGTLLGMHFLLWTASLNFTSIAASALLVSMHPVIVLPLARRFLGEAVGLGTATGMAIAVIGTLITFGGDIHANAGALFGDTLALAGAVCLAGYLLVGRQVRAELSTVAYSVRVYSVAAVIAVLAALVTRSLHAPDGRAIVFGFALAVVCTIAGHTLYNWALRHVGTGIVSIAFLGEPPLAAALGFLIVGSAPSRATVIGGILILVGVSVTLGSASTRRDAGSALEEVQ